MSLEDPPTRQPNNAFNFDTFEMLAPNFVFTGEEDKEEGKGKHSHSPRWNRRRSREKDKEEVDLDLDSTNQRCVGSRKKNKKLTPIGVLRLLMGSGHLHVIELLPMPEVATHILPLVTMLMLDS